MPPVLDWIRKQYWKHLEATWPEVRLFLRGTTWTWPFAMTTAEAEADAEAETDTWYKMVPLTSLFGEGEVNPPGNWLVPGFPLYKYPVLVREWIQDQIRTHEATLPAERKRERFILWKWLLFSAGDEAPDAVEATREHILLRLAEGIPDPAVLAEIGRWPYLDRVCREALSQALTGTRPPRGAGFEGELVWEPDVQLSAGAGDNLPEVPAGQRGQAADGEETWLDSLSPADQDTQGRQMAWKSWLPMAVRQELSCEILGVLKWFAAPPGSEAELVAAWRCRTQDPDAGVRRVAWEARLRQETASTLEPDVHLAVLTESNASVLEVLSGWYLKEYGNRPGQLPACWMQRYLDFERRLSSSGATDDVHHGYFVCRQVLFHLDREFRLKSLLTTSDSNELEFVLYRGVFDRDILHTLIRRVERETERRILADLKLIHLKDEVPWEDRVAWTRAWLYRLMDDDDDNDQALDFVSCGLRNLSSLWAAGLAEGRIGYDQPPPLWDEVLDTLRHPPTVKVFWKLFTLARAVPWRGRRASLFAALQNRYEELALHPWGACCAAMMRLAQYELILEVASSPAAQENGPGWRHLRELLMRMEWRVGPSRAEEDFWRVTEAVPTAFSVLTKSPLFPELASAPPLSARRLKLPSVKMEDEKWRMGNDVGLSCTCP